MISGKKLIIIVLSCLFSQCSNAKNINIHEQVFKIKLGASRIIYNDDVRGAVLSVFNEQKYPILVQGKVYRDDKKTPANFIVTPPIFRLEANQQTRLRIIDINSDNPKERESLYWICVTGIPPKDTDMWFQENKKWTNTSANINLEVSASQCIKLLRRPDNLAGNMLDAASKLVWEKGIKETNLRATNQSPYYINLVSVSVGRSPLNNITYLPPYSSHSFSLPRTDSNIVTWRVYTDEGGESREFSRKIGK